MIVVGCSHGMHVAKKIATKAKRKYSELFVERFPDNELHIRFKTGVKGKKVVLVQSFYSDVDSCIVEVMLAAGAAKEMGARSVCLMAPFFPYMRQDKMFNPGEAASIHILGKVFSNVVDEIFILDPHLHREKTLGHIFSIPAHRLSANPLICEYIRKNVKNALIVGPDWESYKWARKTASMLKCESTILQKDRLSSRKVKVKFKHKINVKGKNIVLVDDMISTGGTLVRTIEGLKKIGVEKFTCIAVHGIFCEGAYRKLKKTGAKIVCSNSIPNNAGKLDIAGLFSVKLIS